ncbi:MAG TPA: OmpH family outer membrane protein [Dyella sp.]|uniref:OmpH family outer membrane protein n=1 Tax=Dyella sp. TaxID=1869338 RepID=UPI002B75191A|nr:OmpH family outer membrane protein [Dyella sp.]HTV84834.1 OmpH family outer membrane protein [Dyella sp.]
MRLDRTLMTFAAICSLGVPFAAAHAQAASIPSTGPAVPGVCMLSREAIFAHAKIGVAASARLKQLTDQAQAQIRTERQPIDADIQTYRSQQASLSTEQRQQREQALAQRMEKVQADQALLARELEATRAKAMEQIAQDAQPIVVSAYSNQHCGLLLDRNVVFGGNMTNDLTPAVVAGLDAKVTTISFNLETLPAASAPNTGATP